MYMALFLEFFTLTFLISYKLMIPAALRNKRASIIGFRGTNENLENVVKW